MNTLNHYPNCHHIHGHYCSVKKTCWRCGGTGYVHDHCHDHYPIWPNYPNYPIWTLCSNSSSLATYGGTSWDSCGCHCCCHTCPDCGGVGYKYECEWVPCPCGCHKPEWPVKVPDVTWTTTTTTTTTVTSHGADKFRSGLGVNKVKSVSG